ncbi:MAG: hypothetical protein K2K02_00115 [Ruminococcus sp.]|nr:hypothetical protein [Ruminococcus sp.]MDE6677422.1 hypothetical protein [Ruminococcus sp.]
MTLICGTFPYCYGDNISLINANVSGTADNGFTYAEIANSKYKPTLSIDKITLSLEKAKTNKQIWWQSAC